MSVREEVILLPVLCIECEEIVVREKVIESIKRAGIISPLLVRLRDDKFQVVLGAARFYAAKVLGFERVPAICRTLSDEEAVLLQIEDKVTQQSFKDRRFSEQVQMITAYYHSVRKQGIRTDLLNEVRLRTGMPQLKTVKYCGSTYVREVFGISQRTLGRYERMTHACEKLVLLVEQGKVSIRAAVELSYISLILQQRVCKVLEEKGQKLSMQTAVWIRERGEFSSLTEDEILVLLRGVDNTERVLRVDRILRKYNLQQVNQRVLYRILDEALQKYVEDAKFKKL